MIDYEIRYVPKTVWKRHTHTHDVTAAECKTSLKSSNAYMGLPLIFVQWQLSECSYPSRDNEKSYK